MTGHVHTLLQPDGDECACGELLCPDTGNTVGYDPDGPGPSYWHLDGSTCFLHQTIVTPEARRAAKRAKLARLIHDVERTT